MRLTLEYCSSLQSIILSEGVTLIEDGAFAYCSSLSTLFSKNITPPTVGYIAFYSWDNLSKIYVPTESVDAYKSASVWRNYASKIEGYDFSN